MKKIFPCLHSALCCGACGGLETDTADYAGQVDPRIGTGGHGHVFMGANVPFGYGLSYSRFEYDSLRVEPTDGGYEVSCRVRNVSQRDGDEVVQLYVSDLVASTVRPVRRLCGFQRVTIPAGRSQTVRFDVNEESLSLIDRFGQRVVEPGEFEFAIGPSSENLKLKQTVNY